MKIRTFIDRPILAGVISALILILGIISLVQLPVEQFPEIAPPTVSVQANYTGANAETVLKSVVVPLEEALNGVENMMYMTSSATNAGMANIRIYFRQGTDPDMATVNVQNRIASAQGLLPTEVTRSGITVRKRQTSNIKALALYSPDNSFDEKFLNNYLKINIEPRLARIAGVGEVNVMGSDYSLRIWLDPGKMTRYNLVPSDITAVLDEQNLEAPTGTLGTESENTFQYVLKYRGRYEFEQDYENMVIKSLPGGEELKLKDVATIELGSRTYTYIGEVNGHPGSNCMIAQTSGSNANEIIEEIDRVVEDIRKNLPNGMEIADLMSTKDFLDASIKNVIKTLIEAIILVILVVYVFLQSFRSTFIPAVSIIVSLIGTFAFLAVAGFSLNMLTLFALVLVIGTVVDDAILVVERVQFVMERDGADARSATVRAMKDITTPMVATTLVFLAIFVPVAFMKGMTGIIYRQFAVTIALAVLSSLVVALTLSPVMCAYLLKPDRGGRKKRFFRYINFGLAKGNKLYGRMIGRALAHSRRMFAAFGVVLIGIWLMNKLVPESFMPQEDQGYFTVELELPEGATIERTREVTDRAMAFLMQDPDVEYVLNVTGSSPRVGSNQARSQLTVILKSWKERESEEISEVMKRVRDELSRYPESKVYLSTPAVIPGLGTSGGFEMVLEARGDAGYADLQRAVDTLMHYAEQRPEFTGLASSMQADIPQLYFDVDRDKAQLVGVSMSDIFSTMKAFTGSIYVNDFNMFNRIYRVYIQADAPYRAYRDNLNLFFVRGADGAMIPVTSLGTTHYTTGAGTIKRFNMFNAATITGEAAHGYSSGQAMDELENIVREKLPASVGVEWSGLSYQEKHVSGQTGLVLALAFLFVFLFLAAQYESWSVPVAVILSLPVAGIGAYLGIWVCGLENNIYFQIGLVMLVGLVAKNAILIVEFAKEEVEKGRDVVSAALKAAHLRFRPIVMTSLAFILGLLPLVFASGPGSASRQGIGTGVFFGMLVAISVGIVFVPFFFVWIYRIKAKLKKR